MKISNEINSSRKARVLLSSITGIIFALISMVLSFVLRTVFIKKIGIEYVGLYTFLTEIFGLLSAVDGGICSSLFIKIHKPIATNDTEELRNTFSLIRIVYMIRSLAVLLIGVILFAFLPWLVHGVEIPIDYIKYIYIVYLLINAASYLFIYYEFLLEAYQKRYLTNTISFIVTVASTILNIACILLYQSFFVYILIVTLSQILTFYICKIIVKREHPELFVITKSNRPALPQVKEMFSITYYTLSSVVVKNTDNILVTKLLGFTVNGIYSSYKMLNSQIFSLVAKIKYAAQDSSRNFIAVSDDASSIKLIDNLSFLYFWISGFCIIALSVLSTPFIWLWLGEPYILTILPVFLTALTLFIDTTCYPMDDAFYSTESYKYRKWVPIVEVIINLVVSIILGIKFGIAGIMIGTLCSQLYKTTRRAYILYNIRLKTSCLLYLKKITSYTVITIFAFLCTYYIANALFSTVTIWNFIIRILLCILIPNAIFYIVFRRHEEFKYTKNVLIEILKKVRKKNDSIDT